MAYGNHTFGVFFNGRPASASFNSVALTCRASKENLSWCIIICWILGVISIKCLLFNMGINSLWSVFYSEMQDQTQNLQTKKSILTDINASTTNFIALWWWLMQYSIYSNFLPVIFNPHWWLSSVYLIHLLLFNSLDIFSAFSNVNWCSDKSLFQTWSSLIPANNAIMQYTIETIHTGITVVKFFQVCQQIIKNFSFFLFSCIKNMSFQRFLYNTFCKCMQCCNYLLDIFLIPFR